MVFMAYLDEGIGEAYVSPQIEKLCWASRRRSGCRIRFAGIRRFIPTTSSAGAWKRPSCFLSGKPLRSAYRVLSRDGRVIWFHCEAKMIRRDDGSPWFIHGVGFDITDLKQTEEALEEERNVVSAILDTVGALVVVLDPSGRIVRFNRACERTTGYTFDEVRDNMCGTCSFRREEADGFRCNLRARCAPANCRTTTSASG